jgi:hypothetical protein
MHIICELHEFSLKWFWLLYFNSHNTYDPCMCAYSQCLPKHNYMLFDTNWCYTNSGRINNRIKELGQYFQDCAGLEWCDTVWVTIQVFNAFRWFLWRPSNLVKLAFIYRESKIEKCRLFIAVIKWLYLLHNREYWNYTTSMSYESKYSPRSNFGYNKFDRNGH